MNMPLILQVSEFVRSYLDAPVSLKEIAADIGAAGKSHNPKRSLDRSGTVDETQYRYFMGPGIEHDCKVYNQYFQQTGAQLLLVPSAFAATPDLAALARGAVSLSRRESSHAEASSTVTQSPLEHCKEGTADDVFGTHNFSFKHLHIPKLVVPTGLTADGRPTAVQLWGQAVPYEQMFDDECSASHDVEFLHLARRAADAIQRDPELRRANAPMVERDLGFMQQARPRL
jgi:hypothetical protein